MSLSQMVRRLAQLRHRKPILIGFLVTLIIVGPLFVYELTRYALDRIDRRTLQAANEKWQERRDDRVRELHELITNPKSGTTPEQISAVSIGMMADEVKSILGSTYDLGIEIFPYNYKYNDLDWVVNAIPIKNVGYVQAAFIEKQLVGLGSPDPSVGRLCGGCMDDMLRSDHPWLAGLPFQVNGVCPVCGSSKVLPSRFSRSAEGSILGS